MFVRTCGFDSRSRHYSILGKEKMYLLKPLNSLLTAKSFDPKELEFWLQVCDSIKTKYPLDIEEHQAYTRIFNLLKEWYDAGWDDPI